MFLINRDSDRAG